MKRALIYGAVGLVALTIFVVGMLPGTILVVMLNKLLGSSNQ